jgi:hypothetical protein
MLALWEALARDGPWAFGPIDAWCTSVWKRVSAYCDAGKRIDVYCENARHRVNHRDTALSVTGLPNARLSNEKAVLNAACTAASTFAGS